MDETAYGLKISVPGAFEAVLFDTAEALRAEGFGVLTSIDVRETLKSKRNRDFRKYIILGACNPPLAERALDAEIDVGLLLPCNVVVYEEGDHAVVAAMAPLAALGIVGHNPALAGVARDADARLRRALAALERAAVAP
jgi:uncharacterized protein (DUF302 family)